MKKYLKLLLIMIMFIPTIVNAENCDVNKINIESIKWIEKSDNVEGYDNATVTGKKIKLNLSMSNVGDNIKYKLLVKNETEEDYELDKNSFKINSDYIDYTFESDDDTNVIKANSSKVLYLKVEYKNEVPDNIFVSGSFNDNKAMILQLSSNDKETLNNPNTKTQYYMILLIIVLIISSLLYIYLRKLKHRNIIMILIIGLVMIPISVYALCKIEINIESNVEITKSTNNFCYIYTGTFPWQKMSIPYLKDETFEEYINRNENVPEDLLFIYSNNALGYVPISCLTIDEDTNSTDTNMCFSSSITMLDKEAKIIDESEVCYLYID